VSDELPLLYLDLDGVLLKRRQPGLLDAFELAPGCLEFLEWATARFQCRWQSSRCRSGWLDGARRAFRHAGARLDDPGWCVLGLVEPAMWRINKTEAIDPESHFHWIDDDPTDTDREWLRIHRHEDRLIKISVDNDPGALTVARVMLEKAISSGEQAELL
jgi:hypothetical protein